MLEMTERKKKILKAIVNEYVMTAEPVGSRTLARRYDFGVSPATIRNEMADLEEANFLEQPHRSAGRIPSDKGYRFYVDALMDLKELSKQKTESIKASYKIEESEIQQLIQQTSQMLSDLTNYTSLVLSPQINESIFQQLQLIPMANRQVLIVLVTDTGLIKNKVIKLSKNITPSELDQISRFLNERLCGLPLHCIDDQLLARMNKKLINRMALTLDNLDFINGEVFENNISKNGKVYLGGTTHILDQPEFNDINKIKSVLKFLEHEQLLYQILGNVGDGSSEVEIVIGDENYCKEISDCSIVIATYSIKERPIGKIGVLGPTRMEYSKVIGSVKFMANYLSGFLTNK